MTDTKVNRLKVALYEKTEQANGTPNNLGKIVPLSPNGAITLINQTYKH